MDITSLSVKQTVEIMSSRNRRSISNHVQILRIRNNIIYTTAARHEGKVLNLKKVVNHLVVPSKDSVPQVFKFVSVKIVFDFRLRKKIYAIAIGDKNSTLMNRRRSFRCFIGEKVNAMVDTNAKMYECVLKDLSATGFALVFSETNVPRDYENIRSFHFLYNDKNKSLAFERDIRVMGQVVRVVDLQNGGKLFGCKFPFMQSIETYLLNKQRAEHHVLKNAQ